MAEAHSTHETPTPAGVNKEEFSYFVCKLELLNLAMLKTLGDHYPQNEAEMKAKHDVLCRLILLMEDILEEMTSELE